MRNLTTFPSAAGAQLGREYAWPSSAHCRPWLISTLKDITRKSNAQTPASLTTVASAVRDLEEQGYRQKARDDGNG
jgi:hypothetical protein